MIVGRRKNKNMQQLLPVSPSCRSTIIINKKDTYRNIHECVCKCLVCMYKRERERKYICVCICTNKLNLTSEEGNIVTETLR